MCQGDLDQRTSVHWVNFFNLGIIWLVIHTYLFLISVCQLHFLNIYSHISQTFPINNYIFQKDLIKILYISFPYKLKSKDFCFICYLALTHLHSFLLSANSDQQTWVLTKDRAKFWAQLEQPDSKSAKHKDSPSFQTRIS